MIEDPKLYQLRKAIAKAILDKNTTTSFTGKFEVWFQDGNVLDIRNSQTWGVSNVPLDFINESE